MAHAHFGSYARAVRPCALVADVCTRLAARQLLASKKATQAKSELIAEMIDALYELEKQVEERGGTLETVWSEYYEEKNESGGAGSSPMKQPCVPLPRCPAISMCATAPTVLAPPPRWLLRLRAVSDLRGMWTTRRARATPAA